MSPARTFSVLISPWVYTMLASPQPERSRFSRRSQRGSSKLCREQEQHQSHRKHQIHWERGKYTGQEAVSCA